MTKQYFIPASLWAQVEEVAAAAGEPVSPSTADEWYAIAGEATAATLTTAVPTYGVTLGPITAGQTVGLPNSGADVEPALSGADGSPPGNYTWSILVGGSPVSLPYTAVEGASVVAQIEDQNHPLGAFSAASSAVIVSAAAATAALSLPTAELDGTDIDWTVTSDTASGTIYAAARLAAHQPLLDDDIINGTGDAVATDTDASPTADGNNGGTFVGLPAGTYDVDIVQVTDGNSNVVSTDPAIDTTPITLTSLVLTAGDEQATLTCETNKAGGVIQWVLTTSATQPNSGQIDAGIDHLGDPAVADDATSVVTAGQQQIVIPGLTNGVTYYFHAYRLDQYGNGTGRKFSNGATPVASGASEITSLSVANQNAAGEIDVAYDISADSLVYMALTTTSAPLTASDLTNASGGAADYFNAVWTVSGDSALPDISDGLPSDTYYLQAVPDGGGDGDVVVSNGFTLETILPTITNAETNVGGNTITLTLSEPVSGINDPADWTASGAPNVTSVSNIEQTTTIVLTLDASYAGTDGVTLEYSGGNIGDAVSNQLAYATGGSAIAVTNNVPASYSDNLVTIPADRHMSVPPVPANQRSFFLFWSGVHAMTSRGILINWDLSFFRTTLHETGVGIHQNFNGGVTISGDHVGSPSLSGVRYHVLIEGHVDTVANTVSFEVWLRREDDAASGFVQVLTVSDTTADDYLDYIDTQTGIMYGRENDPSRDGYVGGQARLAVWVSDATAAGLQIADPSSTALHNAFVDPGTGLTVDPATSQALLAGAGVTRVIDLYGDAANLEIPNNDGTLTLTPNEGAPTNTAFENA